MAKRAARKISPEPDFNQVSQALVRRSTGQYEPVEKAATEDEILRVMRELGRRGGKIGGKKRAESMTPQRRSEIALKAARARWVNKNTKD